MIDPDMLEHADQDDAVVLPVLFAVVAKIEIDPVGKPRCRGASRRELCCSTLRGSDRLRRRRIRWRDRARGHPSPGRRRALFVRVEQQLAAMCRFLLSSCAVVEVVAGVAEIATGILPALIRNSSVELVR